MSVKALSAALSLLLLSGSCLMGAEEGLNFPNYLQASRTLPGEITVPPVFSAQGNYGIAASGDTLYHMELRHGRVHGRTPAGETIEGWPPDPKESFSSLPGKGFSGWRASPYRLKPLFPVQAPS